MNGTAFRGHRVGGAISLLAAALMIATAIWSAGSLPAAAHPAGTAPTVLACPGGQCFQDVPPANPFFNFINNLYLNNIISGYTCGGPGEPCVPPDNRPYYRPNANVTRGQMSKFVDNGRRNIADAVGLSLRLDSSLTDPISPTLVITAAAGVAVAVHDRSTGGVFSFCDTPNTGCWALQGNAGPGNIAATLAGGQGNFAFASDDTYAAMTSYASGVNAPAETMQGHQFEGGIAKTDAASAYSFYVDHPTGGAAALVVNGTALINQDLIVGGSKTGYVVDIMQDAGTDALEPGDVVTVVGAAAPVLGNIPLVTVRKADTAYDTGVVGVVDKAVYVPDAATRAAFAAQQQAYQAALDRRAAVMAQAVATGTHPDLSQMALPTLTITDADGSIHSLDGVSQIPAGGYANVVTLGSYQGVKVDASYGPIHTGDLLVASPHAGYAMKASDRAMAAGATIGKALADLDKGTAVIPVLVTLK